MFKFVHTTDVHISDRPVQNRQETYVEEIKAKLMEVQKLCNTEERVLFLTGDLFEHPNPRQVSHALVQWLIGYFRDFIGDVYLIAGNHDLTSEGIASLAKQPLGTIIRSGAVHWVQDGETEFVAGNGSHGVVVQGLNYHEDGEHDPAFYEVKWRAQYKDSVRILLAHGMLCPPGTNYPFDHVQWDEVKWGNTDLVLYGHPHDDHGIGSIGDTQIASCGSLSRRSRVQKRSVYVTLGEVDDQAQIKLTKHKLKCPRKWQDIFREVVTEDTGHIDQEMLELAGDIRDQMSVADIDFTDFLERMKPELKEDTYNCVKQYIHEAGLVRLSGED